MSKKKRPRLNDQPIEGFADLEDELPAAGPAPASAHKADAAPPARERVEHVEPVAAAGPPPPPTTARPVATRRPSAGRSAKALPWSLVYMASVIVAGVGLGGAVQLANAGVANGGILIAGMALVVGVVAAFGGRALGSALRNLERDRNEAGKLVDRLTALRLDNEVPWTDAALRDHPTAGAFASEVLGAWRLQGARLRRVNGVEGEVHRLQKALAENAREVLTGRFDSPAIGSLADEMVRFLDARNADAAELAELRRHNRDEAEAIVALIQEARAWNRATLEQIGTQGAALERMARRLEDLGSALGAGDKSTGTSAAGSQAAALLADIRRDLDARSTSRAPQVAGLDDLAAQGSKLAFQIAMEVARLGPRGERLQPMSQSLEDLTTTLRQALDGGAPVAGEPSRLGAVLGKIDALSKQIGRGVAVEASPEALEEISRSGPVVGKVAANLADVARRFQVQSERLVKLGESFGALTGAPFDASALPGGQAEPAADNGLRVVPQDPFGREGAARAAVDPFVVDAPLATTPVSPLLSAEPSADTLPSFVDVPPQAGFSHDPQPEPLLESAPEPEPETAQVADDDAFVIERTSQGGSMLDHGADLAIAPLELETMVPVRDEQPYLPTPRPVESEADRIHDLSEFGAVRLDQDPAIDRDRNDDRVSDDDQVHDLAEFGAVRVA
jgi:hypothetical protein